MDRYVSLLTLLLILLFGDNGKISAQQRSVEQVKAIALNGNQKARRNALRHSCLKSTEMLDNIGIDSCKEAFYLYRFEGQGQKSFVIVSGDERMPAVLAYSDENQFDVDNMPPAVRYWLECYVQEYKALNPNVAHGSSKPNISLLENGVSPILKEIQWGQSEPYNNLCPSYRGEKTYTGCVATAMAQIMRYYSYPVQGKGQKTYRTETNRIAINHDFSNDIFDWHNMLDSYNGEYTDLQANSVSVLMASCGASVNMDYGISSQGGSGAYQSSLLNGYIENFGYDNDAALVIRDYCSTEDWHNLLISELNAGRPVNYSGFSMRDGGHSFVIDGYRKGDNSYPDYHLNWGWDGSCDGYYQIANLHPQEDGIPATQNPFSQSQQMTVGVMPEDGVDNSTQMLISSKLNCNLSKARIGQTISFNVSSLYNSSYKKFLGTISVALMSEDGELRSIGTGNVFQLSYLDGTGSINFSCPIPNELNVGKYIACLVYKLFDETKWKKVYSSSYPSIEITVDGTEDSDIEPWSEIGCSEMELLQDSEKSIITARLYELVNLQPEAFMGSLCFTFADENGVPLFSFGSNSEIPELGYFDYLTEPILLSGNIEKYIPDGRYRLYVSAKREKNMQESYVVHHELASWGNDTAEMYLQVKVKDGVAYIDNKEYEILPTNIRNVQLLQDVNPSYYSLDGRKVNSLESSPKGIYIMQQNGKTKKVCR